MLSTVAREDTVAFPDPARPARVESWTGPDGTDVVTPDLNGK
jgi:hypothetical protein